MTSPGQYVYRDIRLAIEGSAGTKEDTADQRLLGTLRIPMGGVKLHRPFDERGSLAPQRRNVIVGEELNLTFEGDMLFDSVMYLLATGILAGVGPSSSIWTYTPSMSTPNTPSSLTFQFGDNLVVYDVAYCVARQIVFSGVMDETVKMSGEFFGRDFEVGAFDPAMGDIGIDPASNEVGLCNKTTIFIDSSGGTPGATVKEGTLVAFNWTLDTGFRPLKYGSSDLFFDAIVQNFPKVTCEITAVFNTTMEAERVLYQAGTARLFQILIGGTGTDTLKLNFSGVYTSFDIEEQDGLNIVRATIESQYDSGLATLFSVVLYNDVSSLI